MNVQYFVGRDHLLEKVDGYLQKVETENDCRKIVILRGIDGKTWLSPSADQS